MSVENLSEEKDWNMLGTLKSLKAVLDDLMEQEGDWDKIYNHFGYMAENETEAKKKLSSFKQKTAVNFSCLRMNALLLFPLLTISACFLIFPLMVISTLGFYIFFYFF